MANGEPVTSNANVDKKEEKEEKWKPPSSDEEDEEDDDVVDDLELEKKVAKMNKG